MKVQNHLNVIIVKISLKMSSMCCCTWSVFIVLSQLAVTKMEKAKISQNSTNSESPYFFGSTKLFKGQLGSVAYLECSIINLNNMTMAWVRMRDRHILTVERETFISDRRWMKINYKYTRWRRPAATLSVRLYLLLCDLSHLVHDCSRSQWRGRRL